MHGFRSIGIGLVAGVGLAALAAQQPKVELHALSSFEEVDTAIHELTLRIDSLESRLDEMESGERTSTANAAAAAPGAGGVGGAGVMKIESIETVQPTQETIDRAKALQMEADNLEQMAGAYDTSASGITVQTSGPSDGTRTAARRQISSYKRQAGDARRQAKLKREEAEAMMAPRQIIRGWTGKKSVEARTTRDLTSSMREVNVGSFITGKYVLTDADADNLVILLSSLRRVERPADFQDRPGDAP